VFEAVLEGADQFITRLAIAASDAFEELDQHSRPGVGFGHSTSLSPKDTARRMSAKNSSRAIAFPSILVRVIDIFDAQHRATCPRRSSYCNGEPGGR
jgi:hypothetical protein